MDSNIFIKGNGISRNIKSKVILSPLAGVTDKIFRKFVRRWSPNSLLFTEMINATSLNLGHGLKKIETIASEEGPIGIQLFDNRPASITEAAIESEAAGAYLIDINMGCPVKKISKKGGGSALLKNPKLAEELVRKISNAVKIPVSVKTRIGWSNENINIKEFSLRLQDAGANMITIHGRTREQGFSGKADWDIIRQIKEELEIPVIANGDITNVQTAINCLNKTKADGVMVGRGVLGSPWIIGEIDAAISGLENFKKPTLEEKLKLLIEHVDDLISEKGNHGIFVARKYISWTCKDFIGAKGLRNNLVKAKTVENIKELLINAINEMKIIS